MIGESTFLDFMDKVRGTYASMRPRSYDRGKKPNLIERRSHTVSFNEAPII